MKDHLGPWLPLRKGSLCFWVKRLDYFWSILMKKKKNIQGRNVIQLSCFCPCPPRNLSAVPSRSWCPPQGYSKALWLPWERKSSLRGPGLRSRTWGAEESRSSHRAELHEPFWGRLRNLLRGEVLYQKPWGRGWKRTPLALSKLPACGEDLCWWL